MITVASENDHAFQMCEASAAVANALDSIKRRDDLVMSGDHRAGVVELIRRIVPAGPYAQRRRAAELRIDSRESIRRDRLYHLRRHDYSRWIRDSLKDESLAEEVAAIEADGADASGESRNRIAAAHRGALYRTARAVSPRC